VDVGGVRECGENKLLLMVQAEVGEKVGNVWGVRWGFGFGLEGNGIGEEGEWWFIGDEWKEGAGEDDCGLNGERSSEVGLMGEEWKDGAGEEGRDRSEGACWELEATRVMREARSEYDPLPFISASTMSRLTSDLWV
jgi:hypothetical protein